LGQGLGKGGWKRTNNDKYQNYTFPFHLFT
jgi:hypothetical protein